MLHRTLIGLNTGELEIVRRFHSLGDFDNGRGGGHATTPRAAIDFHEHFQFRFMLLRRSRQVCHVVHVIDTDNRAAAQLGQACQPVDLGRVTYLVRDQDVLDTTTGEHFGLGNLLAAHTNSATEAITRLMDMGVEPFLISSSVNGVLAQRLVKTICPKCKVSSPMTKDQMSMLKVTPEEVNNREIFYGTGCDPCGNTGYKGRRGLYEMLQMADETRELIANRTPALMLREKCVEHGMQTLRMDGLKVMFEGVSSFEEVMKYT